MLNTKNNQRSKFRTIYRVKVKNNARGTYNTNSPIKFKTRMLKSSLCDYYIDAYIFVKRTVALVGVTSNRQNKKVIFKNYERLIDCINKINNTLVDNAKNCHKEFSFKEFSNNYSKTSGGFMEKD